MITSYEIGRIKVPQQGKKTKKITRLSGVWSSRLLCTAVMPTKYCTSILHCCLLGKLIFRNVQERPPLVYLSLPPPH